MQNRKFKSAWVKPLRDLTGDTQESLAYRLGCRGKTISNYENGHGPEEIQGSTAILLFQVLDDEGIDIETLSEVTE